MKLKRIPKSIETALKDRQKRMRHVRAVARTFVILSTFDVG